MLKQIIDRYLELRHASGFEMKVDRGLLHDFARFAADRCETWVRRQTATDWAAKAPSPSQRECRLGMVRRFADHARAEDPAHEIIPQKVFASGRRRRTFPQILSPEELRHLLDATANLRPRGSLRPLTYYTLFGLLSATGLRISEAMHLVVDDVTADGLIVRKTKFRKSRMLPLHETTQAVLEHYLQQRQTVAGSDNRVFISTKGRALTYAMINGTFHFLLKRLDLRLKPGQRPRIHNLRHLFAVRALEKCTGNYDQVTRQILALSTYLGHAHVTDTYWYLQATPCLMACIADACELFIQGEKP
jgi:integrase/recombinase XerD